MISPTELRDFALAAAWRCPSDSGMFREGCADCEEHSVCREAGRRGLLALGFTADAAGIKLANIVAGLVEALDDMVEDGGLHDIEMGCKALSAYKELG